MSNSEYAQTLAAVSGINDTKDIESGSSKVIRTGYNKALDLLQSNTGVIDLNSPAAVKVLRKIDFTVLPILCAIYTMMLMDKSSLSFAAIMGIKADCNLNGSEYSWLGSMIYFGYLAGDIPATYILQRYAIDKAFAVVVIVWGVIVALHAVCGQFASLAVLRFLLGFGEVFTTPTILHIFASWYTKHEQVVRLPIWYTCYGLANILGGFFSWCIYQSPSLKWQALFIFYGCLTVLLGVILFFLVPASPTRASWLNDTEKTIALERVRMNKTGTEVFRFDITQLTEAFLDPRLYVIFFSLVSTGLPTGGITVFGPSIISGFGFGDEKSTLLSMAPGAVAVLGVLACTIVAKYSNRTTAGFSAFVLSIIGTVMMFAIPSSNYKARYGGYVLALLFPLYNPFLMAMMTAGVAGSTKKFAFGASYQLGYAVGNIIGPQTYRAQDAPNYYPAKYTMLAFLVFGALLTLTLGGIHKLWNIRRDKRDSADALNGITPIPIENEEFLDITDFNIRSFRYPI